MLASVRDRTAERPQIPAATDQEIQGPAPGAAELKRPRHDREALVLKGYHTAVSPAAARANSRSCHSNARGPRRDQGRTRATRAMGNSTTGGTVLILRHGGVRQHGRQGSSQLPGSEGLGQALGAGLAHQLPGPIFHASG